MIQQYENSLRSLISLMLGESDITDFKVSSDRIEKWKEKREIEKKKYNGVLSEVRIIYYSDFYDLGTIVSKHWAKFKDVLDDKKRFEVLFDEVQNFRNTLSHGRELLPYQEEFLKGIVGDLKTKIILFHNKNMNVDDYFIKILKISDNLGNIWDDNNWRSEGFIKRPILRVGDTFELLVDAYDPKGKEINYEVKFRSSTRQEFNVKNKEGRFTIDVTKEMISKNLWINISASTDESEYENRNSQIIVFSVLP
jgi:hypothetical protein